VSSSEPDFVRFLVVWALVPDRARPYNKARGRNLYGIGAPIGGENRRPHGSLSSTVIPPEHTDLFDFQGCLVLEGILGAEDLARLNGPSTSMWGPGSDRFRGYPGTCSGAAQAVHGKIGAVFKCLGPAHIGLQLPWAEVHDLAARHGFQGVELTVAVEPHWQRESSSLARPLCGGRIATSSFRRCRARWPRRPHRHSEGWAS
jgi:hypothetical protein